MTDTAVVCGNDKQSFIQNSRILISPIDLTYVAINPANGFLLLFSTEA